MYSRILFAVDDDRSLAAAVPAVAAFARRWGADVRVLHVHPVPAAEPNGAGRRLVVSVVERLEAAGVQAEGEIRLVQHGEKVAKVIAGAAEQAGADLVAIGSHGRSDLGALFLGSVSNAVAAGLEVPVLVVGAGSTAPAEPGMVLVAVDGSEDSDRAVDAASDVAATFGAKVHVLHVRLVMGTPASAVIEPDEQASAAVLRAVRALEARGIEVDDEVAVGQSVVPAIVGTAERIAADLVVLGSRRPSHMSGLLLGSIGHQLVHRLRCPVLLARHVKSAEPVG